MEKTQQFLSLKTQNPPFEGRAHVRRSREEILFGDLILPENLPSRQARKCISGDGEALPVDV